jgi:SAM-dependent methyltransferase
MIDDWYKYLTQIESRTKATRSNYLYPVTDEATNTRLQLQDPNKETQEQALITTMLEEPWQVAIDFGCGTGAHFHLFDGQQHRKNLLIGIDPDCRRVEWARQLAEYRLHFVRSHILCGDIKILEKAPRTLKADVVLCSQVLGHVSEEQALRIIKGFHRILRKNDRCGLAIPIIGAAFKENPQTGAWSGKEDFTHLVAMDKSPGDQGFRRHITLEEFNQFADTPERGVLPVRSFLIPDFPNPTAIDMPFWLDTPPPTITEVIAPFFVVEKCAIYSIHRDPGSPVLPLGDLYIQLRRK